MKYVRPAVMLCMAAAALGGCTHAVPPITPPVAMPAHFTQTGSATMHDQWWRDFDDSQLDALITEAMGRNLTLAGAWDRLALAEATARKAGADLWPELDASAGAGVSKSRTQTAGRTRTDSANTFSLGLAASYEVDLWGRIHSIRDAAALDAQAAEADVQTAAITLAADVAITWYRWLEQQGQLQLVDAQIKTNQQVLDLVSRRFEQGVATAADVLRQRQLVESTRAVRIDVAREAALLEHQLAILLGRPPQAKLPIHAEPLVQLPALPQTGVPTALLTRRPDLHSAYLGVAAADQRMASAIADQYPKLALTAEASTSAERVRDLFDNWLASLAANLAEPIFDAGRKHEEVNRQRALVSEALHGYGQTVLEALGEVEDALVQEQQSNALLANLDGQLKLSNQVLDRLKDRYVNGSVQYLDVLDALVTQQSLERTRLTAERQRIEYRIALCRALGGGWQMDRPELASPQTVKGTD